MIALGWMAACGPGDATPSARVPMRSLCGQPEGPIPLLALDEHEDVAAIWKHDDRWLIEVETYDEIVLDPPALGEILPQPVGSRLVSVDACGGDPRELLSSRAAVARHGPVEDSIWLACTVVPQLVALDPYGEQSPRVLANGCPTHAVLGHDVVFEQPDANLQPMVFVVALDEGGETPQLLADGRFAGAWAHPDGPREAFVRFGADLLAIDLDTDQTETIAVLEPLDNAWVDGGRYIRITEADEPDFVLVDRETGREIDVDAPPEVDAEGRNIGTLWRSSPDLLSLRRAGGTMAVWLPELTTHRTDDDWTSVERVGDRLAFTVFEDYHGLDLYALDGPDASPRMLRSRVGAVLGYEGESALMMEHPVKTFEPQDLLSVPLDGSTPTIVAHQLAHHRRLTDGRWATTRRNDLDEPATLLVVDADGDPLGRIDDDAVPGIGPGPDPDPTVASEALIYMVRGPDRRGLWYAELP